MLTAPIGVKIAGLWVADRLTGVSFTIHRLPFTIRYLHISSPCAASAPRGTKNGVTDSQFALRNSLFSGQFPMRGGCATVDE